MAAIRGTQGHGFPPGIATTAPAPSGRGRGPEAGRGGAGETCESLRETGETPAPRAPTPNGDSHHGPLHEDMSEKKGRPRDKPGPAPASTG